MEDFKIVQPSPLLAPYIKHYWLLKTTSTQPTLARILPTGMLSLIFHRGNKLLSTKDNIFHPRAFLCGYETSYDDLSYLGVVNMITVVFYPAGAHAFFPTSLSEINGLRVSPDDIEDKTFGDLEKRLTDTEDDSRCISLIEQFLLKKLYHLDELNSKRVSSAIQLINSGQTNVVALASDACLSPKQFTRIFSEHTGANPKEFIRIVRFQRALFSLQTHQPNSLTELAFHSGYYDQPHLIKEFKAISGYTPKEYLNICLPHSDYFSKEI